MASDLVIWQQLLCVLFVTILVLSLGRKIPALTRSLVPFKEPVSYFWFAFIIATYIVYAFIPEWWFLESKLGVDIGTDLFLALIATMCIAYPIGYHFGEIRIIYLTIVTLDENGENEKVKTNPYVYYYYKGQLCLQVQGLKHSIKTLLGFHEPMILPFSKIKRYYQVESRSRYLKIKAAKSASCRKHIETPVLIKKFFITWKIIHHEFIIGDHNTEDPIDYMVETSSWITATETTEALNAKVAGLEIERGKDKLTGGITIVRNLRELRIDDDIRQQVEADVTTEKERREKERAEGISEMIKTLHNVSDREVAELPDEAKEDPNDSTD